MSANVKDRSDSLHRRTCYFSGRVQGNPVPVKVIVGEHDPALSAQVMEQTYLALLPNAELEVLANAGHYPMFETPVALATAMEEFLGRE